MRAMFDKGPICHGANRDEIAAVAFILSSPRSTEKEGRRGTNHIMQSMHSKNRAGLNIALLTSGRLRSPLIMSTHPVF